MDSSMQSSSPSSVVFLFIFLADTSLAEGTKLMENGMAAMIKTSTIGFDEGMSWVAAKTTTFEC